MITGMLKSYRETVASIEKCRKIKTEYIVSPHYGLVPEGDTEFYWDYAAASVNQHKDFVLEKIKKGALFEEILEEYTKEFWNDLVAEEQPIEAFLLNAQYMIQNLIREFPRYGKDR